MKRFLIAIGICIMPAAQAIAAPAPATAPAAAGATSRPTAEQLHTIAYGFLRDQQYQKAATPLESAYKARPLAQQPRSLVLNHALLDIAMKQNAMRAVKDLRDYLAAQEQGDERAVNLLGAALDVAGRDERMPETELYQSAQKQLEQSIKLVERLRPGERKWGSEWKPQAEFADLDAKRDASRKSIREARQAMQKALHEAEQAAAKVDRIEGKGEAGKKKVVAKRSANLDAARRESAEAEKHLKDQKAALEAARKNEFAPTWSTDLPPIDPATPNAGRTPPPATRPAK